MWDGGVGLIWIVIDGVLRLVLCCCSSGFGLMIDSDGCFVNQGRCLKTAVTTVKFVCNVCCNLACVGLNGDEFGLCFGKGLFAVVRGFFFLFRFFFFPPPFFCAESLLLYRFCPLSIPWFLLAHLMFLL